MVRYIGPLFLGFVLGYVDNERLVLSQRSVAHWKAELMGYNIELSKGYEA